MTYRVQVNRTFTLIDLNAHKNVEVHPGVYVFETIPNPVCHEAGATDWYRIVDTQLGTSLWSWNLNQCYPDPIITILV